MTGDDFGNVINGNDYIDDMTGLGGDDTLNSGANNDRIVGGLGHDLINGGTGNDVLEGGNDSDTINGGDGDDKIYAMLGGNADGDVVGDVIHGNNNNDTITGTGGTDTVFGDAGIDTLRGGGGNDTLTGGTEADSVDGAAGNDIVSYATASGAVTVILTDLAGGHTGGASSGADGSDTLIDVENIIGSNFADSLSGNNLANVLNGGLGIDAMSGGDGADTYYANVLNDTITEVNASLATGGNDVVYYTGTAGTCILGANLERLVLSGVSAFNGTGNALANTIVGNSAANTLDGGIDALADALYGNGGDDIFIINTASDNIIELACGGNADRAKASVSFMLGVGDNIEFLETTNAAGIGAINLTGNEVQQSITGNAGANVLNGGIDAVADVLTGGLGNAPTSSTPPTTTSSSSSVVARQTGQRRACRSRL